MSIASTAQITITSVNDGAKGDKGDSARTYITLNTGEDLNTKIAKDKVYVTPITSVCASLKNTPSGFISGECRMEVEQLGSDGYLIQRLFCKAGSESKTFTRTYSSGTFGSWVQLGVKGDKGDDGTPATTVEIGLSSIQIPVTVAGLVKTAQTVDVSFGGFYGSSRLSCTAAVSNLPTGITATVTDATASANGTIRLTIAKDATLGGNLAGLMSIALTCNTKSFSRTISWVKAVDALSLQEEISAQADDISSINTSITSMTTELAKKALASDLTALEGDVEDNASAISGLATRVTSAEGTITAHGTSITQNANAIALKASQSALDTLSGTVSSHGTSITQQASSIEALATRVTNTETVNTSQGTAITQNANAITLKASKTELDNLSATVTSQGTSISQNATAIATKVTQTQVDDSIAAAKSANFGYRYATDITIYGDSDKFYPVVIKAGNQDVKREIFVFRGYAEKAPGDWYTSTHKGGLTLKIKCNFGGWGGANYSWEIIDLEEMYSLMFSGAVNVMSNMAFAIFLRGGGTTGAVYHLYSDQSLTTEKYGIASPQICLNGDSLGVTGQYSWNVPAYRGMKNSASGSNALLDAYAEEIRIRRITKLSQNNDTRLTNAQSSITQNANGITALATRMTNAEGSISNHQTSITQNADAIALRVQSFDANGTALSNAKLEVGSKDNSGYIHLDAQKVIIDGSVKAAQIDVDDLMAKDLQVGNSIRSARFDKDGTVVANAPDKGFFLGSDGRLKADNAEINDGKFNKATVSGTFTSNEFETRSASDNPVTISFSQAGNVYFQGESWGTESTLFSNTIGAAEEHGTAISNNPDGNCTYNLTGVTGSLKGQAFTSIIANGPYGVKTMWRYTTPYVDGGALKYHWVYYTTGNEVYYVYSPSAGRSYVTTPYGSWDSNDHLDYVMFSDDLYNKFSGLALDSLFEFTGTVTSGTVSINSAAGNEYKIQKTSNAVCLYDHSGTLVNTIQRGTPPPLASIAFNITVKASLAGIAVMNITPKSAGVYCIGASNNRFKEIWGTTITANVVWGAVAN